MAKYTILVRVEDIGVDPDGRPRYAVTPSVIDQDGRLHEGADPARANALGLGVVDSLRKAADLMVKGYGYNEDPPTFADSRPRVMGYETTAADDGASNDD